MGAVGRPLRRNEDGPLVSGTGEYVDDVVRPQTLHARFLRSPEAHARLRSLGTEAAERLEGVVAVFTASDLGLPPLTPPLQTPGALLVERPVLAEEKVRFAGEALAVVVAESAYIAEDAAELIEIDLDPLPVLADPDAATAPGAPPIHDHPTNVLFEGRFEHGDVDALFADAPVVVELSLSSGRQTALPIEPRGTMAEATGGALRVWASTQAPHMLAGAIADMLGINREAVSVTCPDVGGGFGLKAHVYPEEIAVAAIARRVGRPVKWIEDRTENLVASCHARDQRIRVRAAAGADGRLLAVDADVTCDIGAYGLYGHGHVLEALGTPTMIPGPYRLAAYRYHSRAVATNKCPEGAYRGVGLPVATFVHERIMDAIAAQSGLDRAQVRRRNLLTPDELPYVSVTNQRYDSGDYPRALAVALDAIGHDTFAAEQAAARSEGRLIGLGLACYVEYTGVNSKVFGGRGMRAIPGFDAAYVRLAEDGRVTLWTTLPSAGQGVATTFAQIAADALHVPFAAVTVARADTAVGGLQGTGTFASRSAMAGGGAIGAACEEIVQRLRDDAADTLEIAPEDLAVADGRVTVRGAPAQGLSFGDLVRRASADRYCVSATFDPPAVTYPYGTHACRVEVHPDTGRVTVDRYVVVDDCGRVINPLIVAGQIHGAVAQGIAGALYESLAYNSDGQLQTSSLMDYLAPTAVDVPSLELHHLEIPALESPNGAKGVGEGGTLAPGAAVANAVSDALKTECNALPVRPEFVRAAAQALLSNVAEAV